MLSSFEVVNFRTFRHLRIERFAGVNLIVGKNGVGKTTLLESLRFYGAGSQVALRECLAGHDEWAAPAIPGEAILDLRALFHGRDEGCAEVEIGPLGDERARLRMRLVDIERVEESDGSYHYEEVEEVGTGSPEGEILKGIIVQQGGRQTFISPDVSRRGQTRGKYVGPPFVLARGVQEADLTFWWETITLTPSQERVIDFLSMLAPIDGITTVENPSVRGARMFKVRLHGEESPVPLSTLGGGLVHVFQLAVAIEYCYSLRHRQASLFDETTDGPGGEPSRWLLIDEVENGIHHTLHARLWKDIFQMARRNDIQVFATTHSLDCLKGFAQAVAEDGQNDGLVIRLEKIEGEDETGAVVIDREGLPIVVRDSIEVR